MMEAKTTRNTAQTGSLIYRQRACLAGLLFGLATLLGGTTALRADDIYGATSISASMSAQEVLQQTTDRVLAVIEDARGYVDEDPERYYAAVQEVLSPVVDFRGFARGVMGEYASGARYRSLDEAGQAKLRDQLERFSDTMRTGLVRTYSKGLLAFGGSRVELDDSGSEESGGNRATLRQLIYSQDSEAYVVIYQMAREKDGPWRMRNLVVENVNLGQIYRSQFESAARRYNGDLDKVIANWSTEAGVGS